MLQLDLPNFNFKISSRESKIYIFDIIRKKHLTLTPEEWVRQNLIHYLISKLDYPKSLIKVESLLTYNNLKKRADIVAYSKDLSIRLLVECKSYKIKLTQSAFNQASIYNKVFKSKYLLVSNGLIHYCREYDWENEKILYLKDIPSYSV